MADGDTESKMPSAANTPDSSLALNDLLFRALDHAVDSVSTGEDLVPFMLYENSQGQRALQRYQSDRLEWSTAQVKLAAGKLSTDVARYAIAYDAYVTVAGDRFDTVVVEAGERGSGPGWALGQRYRKASGVQQFEVVGNPMHLGSVEDRFEHSA